MLLTAFEFSLNNPCPKGLVTLAKFDSTHPSLASATSGGRVLIHTPFAT